MADLSMGTVMLILVGIGIIVVGVLLLLNQTPVQQQQHETERIVIRENPWWPGYPGRIGPYYSHLPVRHLVY